MYTIGRCCTTMITLATAGFASLIVLVLYWLLKSDPPPVAGVYPLPGKWYWVKRAIFSCVFWLRERKAKKNKHVNQNSGTSKGYGSSILPAEMETIQPLPMDPYAMDSVYIGAYSREGPNLALRVARRAERRAEIWLHLDIPGVGYLQHPVHPDTAISNTDPNSFTAGGLRFDVMEPMRTWRVSFSGQLRLGLCNSLENKPDALLDTQFSFVWKAFASPFNYDTDLDSSLLGDAIAREPWSRDYFSKLQKKHQTHYEQWGELQGTLLVEGHPLQHLRLTAIRDHSFGVRKWTDFHRYVYCFLHIENGITLQIGAISQPGMLSHLRTGCLTYPSGEMAAVSDVNFNLWEVGEEQEPPAKWSLSFAAGGESYLLQVQSKTSGILYHEADRGGMVFETFCNVTLNDKKGCGLSEFFYRNKNKSDVEVEATLPLITEPDPDIVAASPKDFVLHFSTMLCQSSSLVGGKGSQLAQLTKLVPLFQELVLVPSGFCVTLAAFEEQLKHCPNLEQLVNCVAETAVSELSRLEAECKQTTALFVALPLCASVLEAIQVGMRAVFDEDLHRRRLAVRSSAAGEDGTEASSAGQMDTFLGLRGEEEILTAVKKCWASAYTYQAVEYRRQHGQPVRTAVGVVIQEMAPAEAAGVMFTCDPLTGNSSLITIDANFGLGESVVSGRCEPDTITVRRNWDGTLNIKMVKTGQKSTKITLADGGIREEVITDADRSKLCIQESVILRLARVGIQIEKYFGSPRDIEWAYADGKIFLLQSRPITTSDQETEEELIHEFDSPLTVKYQCLTTGNISEMMPGAVTPLTLSTFARSINKAVQVLNFSCGARLQVLDYPKAIFTCGNHMLMSLLETSLLPARVAGTKMEVMALNLLGELLTDLSLTTVREYLGRSPPGAAQRLLNSIKMVKSLNKGATMTKVWEERLRSYTLGEEVTTAAALYQEIDDHLKDYDDVWSCTLINSAKSGSWSTILLSILAQGSLEWTTRHYGDIALLLSQCSNVYSAEVPTAVQELARQIVVDGLKDTFLSSSNEECIQLMRCDKYPTLKKNTEVFLQRHGHRCIREAEMREKSWHLDPAKLISVIKAILETGAYESTVKDLLTPGQLVSKIKTPLPFIKRKILQYVLPAAWKAVGQREWGKSISILMNDLFKCGYWKLASLMVKEGRLPDEDLLFFLTHYEIGTVIKTRSAQLLMKAQRRRKILSKQMSLQFPKISSGYPKPIETNAYGTEKAKGDTAVLKGMPVSRGVVKGPAKVVLNVKDAHTIQAGDILVAVCTDIGWTPYFPLLAGLVTELGGLMSHGAVVAREYGIPCIVNVRGATVTVTNGMMLELNGEEGSLCILGRE